MGTMKGNLMKFRMVMIALMVFALPTLVSADVFMKEKQHTDGMTMMGQAQPPQDKTATIWIAKDKMRRDQGDTSSIAKLEKDRVLIYHLNHQKKSYTELSLGSNDLQDTAASMAGDLKVKVVATDESRKIGNWNCRKYLQEMDMGMMPITSEIWASEDIKVPYFDFYERVSTAMMAQQPGMKMPMEGMQEEMKKIKGVPVLTVTNMTIMKNTTVKSSRELLEIKEDTAPPGTFDIPQGYTKQAMPQNAGERMMPGKQKPK
jgi:hypothetical protein